MGVGAILVMWPSEGVSIWYLSLIGPVVSEEKVFENVDRRMDGGRSHRYTLSSPIDLQLRWATKQQTTKKSQKITQQGKS